MLLQAQCWQERRLLWASFERSQLDAVSVEGRAVSGLTFLILFNDAVVVASKYCVQAFPLQFLWIKVVVLFWDFRSLCVV